MELFLYFLIAFSFSLLAFMPYYTKKDIFFGYRISEDLADHAEVKGIKRWYARTYLIVFVILTAVLYWLEPFLATMLLTLGFMVLGSVLYLTARARAKRFVDAHREEIQVQSRVVVSTEQGKMSVSPYWFAIPLLMVLTMFVLIFVIYDQIPDQLPMRYDFQGNVTGYDEKSMGRVMLLPCITLVANLMLIFVFMSIWRAKREISGKDLEAARIRAERFRKMTAGVVVYIACLLTLLFFLQFLRSTGVMAFNLTMFKVEMIAFPIIMIIPPIVLAIRVGQGGSRLKVNKSTPSERGEVVRDDDRYWKWGVFYFNPDDSSVWVEKRMGIGYTLNFARPGAWVAMGVILAFILASILLPMFLK